MKKLIIIAASSIMMAVAAFFAASNVTTSNSDLLMANIEALTRAESGSPTDCNKCSYNPYYDCIIYYSDGGERTCDSAYPPK